MVNPILYVPQDLAEQLLSAGLVTRYAKRPVDGASAFVLAEASAAALVVLDAAGNMVALTGVRPPLNAIAERIGSWWRGVTGGNRKCSLLAIGPKGQFRLEVDQKPDIAAITALLEMIYEEDS